ncbi:MAG: glycosyltransferase [Candidatus Dojkabacteria bacterium]|nr:glycosyltransferase [Candidatus Dojkabacteria bacterium]
MFLVCAGCVNFPQRESILIKRLGCEGKVRYVKFKNGEEFTYIYNNVTCFVFPSLYEGFAIPVLEAFVCDCPAVISECSSLPEVGGDALGYFDPYNIKSIEDSVRKV